VRDPTGTQALTPPLVMMEAVVAVAPAPSAPAPSTASTAATPAAAATPTASRASRRLAVELMAADRTNKSNSRGVRPSGCAHAPPRRA
jgi:hypothetical protein